MTQLQNTNENKANCTDDIISHAHHAGYSQRHVDHDVGPVDAVPQIDGGRQPGRSGPASPVLAAIMRC